MINEIIDKYTELELSNNDKFKLTSYDEEFEKKLATKLLNKLVAKMLKWEVTPDFVNWFKESLDLRLHLIKSSFNIKQ